MSGLATLKTEGSLIAYDYLDSNKSGKPHFSKYYELRYEEGVAYDPRIHKILCDKIRAYQGDKHDLIAAIAHEILNEEGY